MNVSEHLDAIREAIPGCRLVSFGDLETGLALRTSATRAQRQDYLEDMLQQAAAAFAASDSLTGGTQDGAPSGHSAIVATPGEIRIFVRSADTPSDVVCCVCDDATEENRVQTSARKLFQLLAGGG